MKPFTGASILIESDYSMQKTKIQRVRLTAQPFYLFIDLDSNTHCH
jgi:hypothetical protein